MTGKALNGFVLPLLGALPFAGLLSILLYILAATKGPTWTNAALSSGIFTAVTLHLASWALALAARRRWLIWVNLVFSLLFFATLYVAMTSCFRERMGNCGADGFIYLGVMNAVPPLLLVGHRFLPAAAALIVALPLVWGTAHIWFAGSLGRALAQFDFTRSCVVAATEQPTGRYDRIRLGAASEVTTGWVVGEASPPDPCLRHRRRPQLALRRASFQSPGRHRRPPEGMRRPRGLTHGLPPQPNTPSANLLTRTRPKSENPAAPVGKARAPQ